MGVVLFVLGAALGSFLNVIATRYDPDRFLITSETVGGRSRCSSCKTTLRWFELIPFVSFLIQRGRCRTCGAKLSFQYFATELVAALIVLTVPFRFHDYFFLPGVAGIRLLGLEAVFTAAFLVLLLLSLIDYRLQIIPDELTIFLGALGLAATALMAPGFSLTTGSFAGHYALLAGIRGNVWVNHLAGAFIGAAFLYILYLVSLRRGIGFGDVKLALALGLLFGWPDVFLIELFAFVIGSVCGLFVIATRRKTLKSFLPFGPFLAVAAATLFFWGFQIIQGYFSLFNLY